MTIVLQLSHEALPSSSSFSRTSVPVAATRRLLPLVVVVAIFIVDREEEALTRARDGRMLTAWEEATAQVNDMLACGR